MKRRWLQKYIFTAIVCGCLVAMTACGEKDSPPEDLLPHGQLAEVLADIYLAEVKAMVTYDLKLQKDQYLKEYLYPEIFRRREISDSAFYRSFAYYEMHPEKYEALMDSVIAVLEQMPLDSVKPSRHQRSVPEAYRDYDRIEQQRIRQKTGSGASE